MTMQSLPLNTLCLSTLNVRTTDRDADIQALAEDIAARGLKQNLVVVPAHYSTSEATEGWAEKWEVIAGGRRFQAFQLLVADGRLPADHPVPCLLEERADASETSLSENLHKVSMNPADEFAAFKTIVATREMEGMLTDDAIAACAKRFGKTVSHVKGRLRLATLAPEILDALRADTISLDAAKAYALTTDHDLQRTIFALHQKEKWRGHNPKYIRDDIRTKTLPLDHPLVTFAGLVEYQAQGGRIEGEMFMGTEGQQRVVDVALLESMVKKIAEAVIPGQVKAEGFKSGVLAKGVSHNANWPKAPAGFEKAWDYGGPPSKAKLKKSIAVYAVNAEGTGLIRVGRFKPSDETKNAEPQRDWAAECAAEQRLNSIELLAARLALPKFAGTSLEGRVYHPKWPSVEDHDDDHVLVKMMIKVPIADIDAQRAEAERQIDEAAAAEAAKAKPQDDEDGAEDLVDSETLT